MLSDGDRFIILYDDTWKKKPSLNNILFSKVHKIQLKNRNSMIRKQDKLI